jgi:ABC-2 type transport system ATP-binding protein
VTTVLHDPSLIILDEPFSGLDPVNSNLIKDEIFRLAQQGSTIIFSTHRMEQVEEICNHIALVNRGKKILDGTVQEIKQHYKQHQYSVSGHGIEKLSLDQAPFTVVSQKENTLVIQIAAQNNSSDVLRFLLDRNIQINAFQELLPSLNDIFIQLVGNTPTARTFEKI